MAAAQAAAFFRLFKTSEAIFTTILIIEISNDIMALLIILKGENMDFGIQFKIRGDSFGGHFINGISMAESESPDKCELVYFDEDKSVYNSSDGYKITAYHIKKNGVYECRATFENNSNSTVTLEMLSSFCVQNISADTIHRATSFWSAEGKLLSQKLTELNMERSWSGHGIRIEKFGQIGSMPVRKWFPFIALEDSESSEFIGVQLYCPSSWQIELFRYKEPLTLTGGLADFDYGHWCKNIAPGESFTTPKATVASGNSLERVCDMLVKAQNPDISPVDGDMPVIFNEYCTSWGNPTTECLEKTAAKLQGSGIKYLVMDSGWYKEQGKDWWSTIGDWNVSKELFPNGLKPVCDMIKSYGLIPGIWFEMENAAPLSEIYGKTEYLLSRFETPLNVSGHRFLDLRDNWCVNYLDEKVIKLLRESGFGYLKIDYNENIGVGCDGAESLGEGLRQYALASQNYFKRIKEKLPDMVIENCASGGHRLEPSTMELCSMASFSDAHECKSIPIIAANLHRLIKPRQSQIWAVLRAGDDIYRTYYSLISGFLGRLCLSGEIFDLPQENWSIVLDAVKFYDEIKHIINNGFTSVIDCTVKDYSDPAGYQIVLRETENEALLIAHTFKNGANPPIGKYLENNDIIKMFGSELNADFRAVCYLLKKSDK